MDHVAHELSRDAALPSQPCNRSTVFTNRLNEFGLRPVASGVCGLHGYEQYTSLTHVSTSIKNMTGQNFGTWLKMQLNRRDMTGSDLARKMDRPPSMINRWAAGDRVPNSDSCERMGHANAAITSRVYIHLNAEHHKAAADQIGRLFKPHVDTDVTGLRSESEKPA
jgi:hypothetical protein